jgi:hypothetical protein
MPRGGARKGAGRKPTPLAQKIAEGNPGKRALKKVEFTDESYDPSTPPECIGMMEKKGKMGEPPKFVVTSPQELYRDTIKYLEPSGCLHLIPADMIMNYVIASYYLRQAQHEMSYSMIVGKNADGQVEITSFTEAMIKLQKNVLATWTPVWDIVSRNSERKVVNQEGDLMAFMFGGRTRKSQQKGVKVGGYAENPG